MNKKTGYMIQMVASEYNDESYDIPGDYADLTAVYPSKEAAEDAAKEQVYYMALSDPNIGEYCSFVNYYGSSTLSGTFPEIFDKHGMIKCLERGNDGRWVYATVTPEAARFIADNFKLFNIQEISVYE